MLWQIPTEVILGIGAALGVVVLGLLRRAVPALRGIESPVEIAATRRAARAETELEDANRTITEMQAAIDTLAKERSLTTVIDLAQQTLAKLSELNGSLVASAHAHEEAAKALEETNRMMQASTKAIEFVATQILNRDT